MSQIKLSAVCLSVLSLLVLGFTAYALTPIPPFIRMVSSTCYVGLGPSFLTTIQSAIDSSHCQIVVVSSGTYTENLTINRDIKILGASFSTPYTPTTIIDGGGNGSVITITGSSSVTIENIKIQNGHSSENGGGIDHQQFGRLMLQSVQITGNTAENYGGGVFSSYLIVYDSAIDNNQAQYGAGIFLNDDLDMQRTTVADNTASECGGGVYLAQNGEKLISDSTFTENSAERGGGICNEHDSSTLAGVAIYNNTATQSGGGLYNIADDSNLYMANSYVAINSPTDCYHDEDDPYANYGPNADSDDTCKLSADDGHFPGLGDPNLWKKVSGYMVYYTPPLQTQFHPFTDVARPDICSSTDQIGQSRPVDTNEDGSAVCELGPIEFQPTHKTIFRGQTF